MNSLEYCRIAVMVVLHYMYTTAFAASVQDRGASVSSQNSSINQASSNVRTELRNQIATKNTLEENSRSLDNLLDDFRREQIYLSSTQLNISRSLQLPEKLAEAEAEEAEERSARAFRAKNEAKTPFIATHSRLSLGYIGRGYDIYYGNPLSDDGVVDQGFRLPVIDLPFNFRFTSDGEYRIPDNVDVISEPSATFGSSYFQLKSESDYQNMLKADASVNAHASGYGLSGSFSASVAYQNSKQEIQRGETTTLRIVGRAFVYKARMSSAAKVSKVSDYFESAIKSLPLDNCEEPSMQELYLQIIEEFGTHYTTDLVMGAKAVQELKFRNSDIDKFSEEGISAKVAAELSYQGFGASVGGGFSAGFENQEKQRRRVQNTNKEQREYYIGGSPPNGNIGTGEGSTETLREWARSASENPVPIQYKLSSIDTLLRPDYFRDLTYGFYEIRKCLRKALITYCMRTIGSHYCNERTNDVSRLKRDTDSEMKKSKRKHIRYGDFIKLTNKNRFLVLFENYGLVSGSTIKPLISADRIQNYDGLFQIVPLEGQESKLQSEVHYGEPFLFRTKEGQHLYMGKRFISDIKKPSEARLMDLFSGKNQERNLNGSRSDIEDFAVFIKRKDLRTYTVSLNVIVECSRHTLTKNEYLVEIKGEEGTVNAVVTTNCTCQYNRCSYVFKWFHSLITEKDIKEIQSVQITNMYGGGTRSVRELQITTIMNGQKVRIRKSLRCTGRNYIVPKPLSPESTTVDLDIYPIQFTFSSKSKQENQPVASTDEGFIHILSSYPKRKFWGKDVSHLLGVDVLDMITINEEGPREHKSITAGCSGMIYPSIDKLVNRYDQHDRIIISFDVTVMVTYIEIEQDVLDFNFAYLNPWSDTFEYIDQLSYRPNIHQSNGTVKMTFEKPLYTSAVKVFSENSTDTDKNLTSKIKWLGIGGCHSALIETGNRGTDDIKWHIEISENNVQSYPFLKVVPNVVEPLNVEEVYRSLENPVSEICVFTIPLQPGQFECFFDKEYIRDYLSTSADTYKLKFENIVLDKKLIYKDGRIDLYIQISVTGLSEAEFEEGRLYLNRTLQTAVHLYPCRSGSPQFASKEDTHSNTTSNAVIAVLSSCFLLIFLALGFLIYRLRVKTLEARRLSHFKDGRVIINLKDCENDDDISVGKMHSDKYNTSDGGRPLYQNDQALRESLKPEIGLYRDSEIFASRTDIDAERVSKINSIAGSLDEYVNGQQTKQRKTVYRL